MKKKIGLALVAVWLLSLIASLLGLVPRWIELAGIGVGVAGFILLWPQKGRKT
jgi:putative exporter of polyketide antibiotics